MPYVDLTKRRIYGIWNQMKRRCSDKNNSSYKNYGAKGIEVCKVWEESFESFYLWALNNGYKDDLTIDRINSTKNYEPNNWHSHTFPTPRFERNQSVPPVPQTIHHHPEIETTLLLPLLILHFLPLKNPYTRQNL